MTTDTLESVYGFLESLGEFKKEKILLFCGQDVKGNLIPMIARRNPSVDTSEIEKNMFEDLMRRVSLYSELVGMTIGTCWL